MAGEVSHIVVIESLPAGERHTGRELYEDVIRRYIEFKGLPMAHQYFEVTTANALGELLRYWAANAAYIPEGILLHLETHGDSGKKGLFLSNGDLITWSELVDLFRPINIGTKNQLYVSLATCNGRHLYLGVDPTKKSPYNCQISASVPVKPSEIIDHYADLFEHLVESGNLITSYLAIEDRDSRFFYKDSEMVFEAAFASAADQILNDQAVVADYIEQTKQATQVAGVRMPTEAEQQQAKKQAIRDTYVRQKRMFRFD